METASDSKNNSVACLVFDKFRERLGEEGHSIELACDTLLSALGMDSLKAVEILFELEEHFGFLADEDLVAEVETIGDMIALFDPLPVTV